MENLRNTDDNVNPQHDFSQELKDLIQQSSSSKKAQLRMIVIFLMVSLFTNLQYNSSNLLYMNPAFYCEGIDGKMT